MNEHIELLIKGKEPAKAKPIKIIMVLVCVFFATLTFLNWDAFFLLFTVGFIIITRLIFSYYDIEYEYEWFNNELSIDRISGKSYRKKENLFEFARLEYMGKLKEYKNPKYSQYKTMDYSTGEVDNTKYEAIVMCKGEMVRLIFEPNDKMLEAIRYHNPQKVSIE